MPLFNRADGAQHYERVSRVGSGMANWFGTFTDSLGTLRSFRVSNLYDKSIAKDGNFTQGADLWTITNPEPGTVGGGYIRVERDALGADSRLSQTSDVTGAFTLSFDILEGTGNLLVNNVTVPVVVGAVTLPIVVTAGADLVLIRCFPASYAHIGNVQVQ